MASAHADAQEIDVAIRTGADMAQADADIDDSELENELNALVKEVESEKAAVQKAEEEEKMARQLSSQGLRAPSDIPMSAAKTEERIMEHS